MQKEQAQALEEKIKEDLKEHHLLEESVVKSETDMTMGEYGSIFLTVSIPGLSYPCVVRTPEIWKSRREMLFDFIRSNAH